MRKFRCLIGAHKWREPSALCNQACFFASICRDCGAVVIAEQKKTMTIEGNFVISGSLIHLQTKGVERDGPTTVGP